DVAVPPGTISSRKPGLSFYADLRIQMPEGAHVRAVPADVGSAAVRVPDLRRTPPREGALPGRDPFQGLGVLQDGLRSRFRQARRRLAGQVGLLREEGEDRF